MSARRTIIARRMPTWITVTVAGGFGLFYAYIVWSAVGLLIDQSRHPLGLNGYGWFVYALPIAFPLVVFGVAFALGHRRRVWEFALVLFAGLTLSAAFWLNIVAYGVSSYALYGA